MLSLDHDGTEFVKVAERDPVIARLQQAAPGLRPPLFHSPYEAAAWSVLSARRPVRQMMTIRQRLSEAHGTTFELAGQQLAAFPLPEALLRGHVVPRHPRPTSSSGCTASLRRPWTAHWMPPPCSSSAQTRR